MAKCWIDRFAELMMEVPLPPPEDMALARAMFALAERGATAAASAGAPSPTRR